MKKIAGVAALFLVLASGVYAAEQSSPREATPLSWLQTRGTMNADDVVAALGIKPTDDQREQIEKATARRNEALQKINADFSRDLQKTLAANDQELAAKVQAESDRQKMSKIRSRQPGRYNGMKKEK